MFKVDCSHFPESGMQKSPKAIKFGRKHKGCTDPVKSYGNHPMERPADISY
ncbi:uncharacterized protein METZ01_LOCUS321927 [marine metagenome]|uniref:Uncharacterized protein n=1 Tax=marine metagenome TaxID=408172 RepID=A0A382P6P6_9ZZZZ